MKKKILWLSDANTAHTRRWVGALSDRGYHVLVFSFTEAQSNWASTMPSVDLESGGFSARFTYGSEAGWQKLAYLKSVTRVRRLIRQFNPILTHAHYVSSYGLLATAARIRPRLVSAWGSDVYSAPMKSSIHRCGISYILNTADSVLSTSWIMRKRVLEFTRRPVRVVPFGIDVNRFTPERHCGAQKGVFTVGSVKTLEEKYGLEYLIRGFAILRDRLPNLEMKLIIVGDGSLRAKLEQLSVSLGISGVTEFRGLVDYDLVHKCHQELDVAVYPSVCDSESFGVSVIESQACGVPVIVSRAGGLTEVVDEGTSGLVVERRDPEAIASALQAFAEDHKRRRQFGEAGRSRVVREYSLERAAAKLMMEYSKFEGH